MNDVAEVNVIIGATSRIGQAVAYRLGRRPGSLILASRDHERLTSWAHDNARQLRATLHPVHVDVRESDQVARFFAEMATTYGHIDHMVNNFGVLKRKPLEEHTDDDWHAVINTNLTGTWRCMRHGARLLTSGGGIVNVASVSGLSGTDWGLAAYVASKFGVVGLTKAAALEFAPRGIRVNSVCPGVVHTDMTDRLLAADSKGYYSRLHPLGRVCEPDEVAAPVEWLCSQASSFVTGVSLPIDGGLMARVM